jgi:hypothetical protein
VRAGFVSWSNLFKEKTGLNHANLSELWKRDRCASDYAWSDVFLRQAAPPGD